MRALIIGVAAGTVVLGGLSQGSSPAVMPSASVYTVTGTELGGVFDWPVDHHLHGVLCAAPNNCREVPYPATLDVVSLAEGVLGVQQAVQDTPGDKIVYGYSQGASVVSVWIASYGRTASAPPHDELAFVVTGNAQRAKNGLVAEFVPVVATPNTDYQVIDVSREYDGFSDFPDHPLDLVATANALAGIVYVHTNYSDVDLYSTDNLIAKDGNITYVLVPTENLPLLEPVRQMGFGELADQINAPLKKIVDAGYDRGGYQQMTDEDAAKIAATVAPEGSSENVTATGVTSLASERDANPTAGGRAKAQGRDHTARLTSDLAAARTRVRTVADAVAKQSDRLTELTGLGNATGDHKAADTTKPGAESEPKSTGEPTPKEKDSGKDDRSVKRQDEPRGAGGHYGGRHRAESKHAS